MNISILGTGMTNFGELWKTSPRELAREAMSQAFSDAKMDFKTIDALFVGNMLSGILGNQANVGSLFAEELGAFVPAFRVEAACASGGLALHNAILSIKAGQYKTAMVLGVEKMTDHTNEEVTNALMAAGSDEERTAGITFPGLYALIARAYMEKYKIDEETLAWVSVKNHYHGSFNPKAQFKNVLSADQVMKSPKVADPLKLLDCSPITDGAAAIIITSDENLIKSHKKPIKILASEVASDTLSLADRDNFTTLNAVTRAANQAYEKAGVKPEDIDLAEVHDCFSIAEVIAVEDLGFSKRGQGAIDIKKGKMTLGKGKIVTNSSGGLKACGHPVGATGVKQIVEIVKQLRQEASGRQVENAKIGLAHNVGGTGTIAAIHILSI